MCSLNTVYSLCEVGIRRVMSHVDAVGNLASSEYRKDRVGTSPPPHPTGGTARAPEKKIITSSILHSEFSDNENNYYFIFY